MTNSTRRPATAADLNVDAIVYKGKGATAYRVVSTAPRTDGRTAQFGCMVFLVKATTQTGTGTRTPQSELTVEA